MLDALDRRFVGALHIAPRASWDDLASILVADPSTLKRRYDRLLRDRVLRVIGQLSWGMHSTSMPVHVFLDIVGDTPLAVIERLRGLPHMQNLAQLSGRYPVYASVHAPSEEATSRAVDQLFATPGIRRVSALPSLRTVRRGSFWDPQFVTPTEREELVALADVAAPGDSNTVSPNKPLTAQERAAVSALVRDGRATAASVGRAGGLSASAAHRLVRRILTEGWVKPRVEIQPESLGFFCNFHLRLRVRPGRTPDVLAMLATMSQVRLAAHVAGDMSVLCAGVVADRAELAAFLDRQVADIPEVDIAAVDVVLAERRRYWLDRDPVRGLGSFTPPELN